MMKSSIFYAFLLSLSCNVFAEMPIPSPLSEYQSDYLCWYDNKINGTGVVVTWGNPPTVGLVEGKVVTNAFTINGKMRSDQTLTIDCGLQGYNFIFTIDEKTLSGTAQITGYDDESYKRDMTCRKNN